MASSFFPKKLSGSPAFISVGLLDIALLNLSLVGWKVSSSSLVISMSESGTGVGVSSSRVEMVSGRGSNAAGNSCCVETFGFLQELHVFSGLLSLSVSFLFPLDEIPSQFSEKQLVWV